MGAILYAGEALAIVPQEPPIFVCMCGRCTFRVPACMTACVCASTRRRQINLGHRPAGAIHFRVLRQGLSLGLDDWVRLGV